MRLNHPVHGIDLDVSPRAKFNGYPAAASPGGVIVGDDTMSRFLAAIDSFPHAAWHQDVNTSLGIPATMERTVFTTMGGVGAVRSVVALDAATGTPKWVYAPRGLPGDPVEVRRLAMPKWTLAAAPIQAPAVAGQPGGTLPIQPALAGAATARRPTIGMAMGGANRGGAGGRLTGRPGGAAAGSPAGGSPSSRPAGLDPTAWSRLRPDDFRPLGVMVGVDAPVSRVPPGHWSNGGLVLAGGRVYAEVDQSIVALNQETGAVLWRYPLARGVAARSLAATPTHLVCCLSLAKTGVREAIWSALPGSENRLVALDLKNGKEAWVESVERPGSLSLSGGLLFLANGDLHAFAPAERTFRLAVDSPDPEDYRAPRVHETQGARCARPDDEPASPKAKEVPRLADATLLRLSWNEPLPKLLERIRLRQRAAPGVTLALSLDWLNADRSAPVGVDPLAGGAALAEEFGRVCQALAAAARPALFDVAPEVNVYLARSPEREADVRALVREARRAIQQASPQTKVLVSFNAEVLCGVYGKGPDRPFGELHLPPKPDPARMRPLAGEVEGIGLTSVPQAGFTRPTAIRGDYLLTLKAVLDRPVFLTRLRARSDPKQKDGERQQAAFLRHLLAACYWLDCQFVAYPDAAGAAESDTALQPGDQERPALAVWQSALRWKPVEHLTVSLRPLAGGVGEGSANEPPMNADEPR